MIVEYAGLADRWAGGGVVHQVRAWWNVHEHSEGQVKRAALETLCPANGVVVIGCAEVIGMDTSTYNTPQLNAVVRIRVLLPEEMTTRAELRLRRYTRCDGCGGPPGGQVVRMAADGAERALCYTCWDPIKGTCKVLHWIKSDGKLQV